MDTSVTELGDSRVRIDVSVDPAEVEHSLEHAAGHLAEDVRMPGFRKGKVPAQLVMQRFGREAVMDAALREFMPLWYERALLDSGVTPIGDPDLNVSELPGGGEPLEFSIEVAVRPKATLGEYRGLEVGRAEPEIPDEAVQAELDRLREGFASLGAVDRPAQDGDVVVMDYAGMVDGEPFEGGEGRDQLVELGSGSLVEGFEEGLAGSVSGDEREIDVTFPEDYRAENLAGKSATFAVAVKEVREKSLPDLDDEFASDASEFETLDELRGAIRERLGEASSRQAEEEFRQAAVDAAAEHATVELPEEIIRARAVDGWERAERSLAARGMAPEAFLQMQGKTREELIEEAMPEAERQLRREAVLAAVADAEDIDVSDDELVDALGPGEGDDDPQRILARLRDSGRDTLLVDEIRMRKAAELLAEAAKPIPLGQAEARERIWTPEKEEAEGEEEAEGGLWTPGSD